MQEILINNLAIQVLRKKIKNIYLRISAVTGKIQLTAPFKYHENVLREFIQTRISWIEEKLKTRLELPKIEKTAFITGEKHYYQGELYTLNVFNSKLRNKVILQPPFIDIYVAKEKDVVYRSLILERWYRKHLEITARQLIAKWQPIMNVSVDALHIKKMKTRWGTCNPLKKRIWLSLELAKKPLHCLEYVVVHEMVHLLERSHNKRFRNFMSQFLPDWRVYKNELNGHS